MSEKYRPAGSNVEYTVPTLDEPADGPKGFRDFADSIPKDLSPVVQISKKTAAYTLLAADSGSVVSMDTSAGDLVVTLPVNSPTFLAPVGAVIVVANAGKTRGKKVTVVAASGVTLRDSAVRTVELYRMVSLIQVEKDSWIINAGTGGTPAPGVPSAPKLDTAVAGPANITVTWSKPVDDGGSPLTGYTVETSVDAGKNWVIGGAVGPTVLSDVLDGLTPSAVYEVRVKAANTNGFGDPSNVLTATPTQPFNDAEGGAITYVNRDGTRFKRHTFSSGATLTVIRSTKPFTLFACGGGGGGGGGGIADIGYGGMGGGSGGAFDKQGVKIPVGDVPVVVGNGGTGSAWYGAGTRGGNSSIGSYLTCGGGGGGNFASPPDSAWHGQPTPGNAGSEGGSSTGGTGGGGQTGTTTPAPPVLSAKGLSASIGAGGNGTGQDSGGAPGGPGVPGIVLVEYEVAPE